MNKDFNTKTYILVLIAFILSLVNLGLVVMISLRVHPPKPVVIKCDFDMKGELDRAGRTRSRAKRRRSADSRARSPR